MNFSMDEMNIFLEALASDTPAPGGGSVSALCGAVSAALVSMAASFTAGREKYKNKEAEMQRILLETRLLRKEFMRLMQSDIDAYSQYAQSAKMPKNSEAEKSARDEAMQQALLVSTEIPLKMIDACIIVEQLALSAVINATPYLITDAAAAAVIANAAAKTASYNVLINLQGISDKAVAAQYRLRMEQGLEQISKIAEEAEILLSKHFKKFEAGK